MPRCLLDYAGIRPEGSHAALPRVKGDAHIETLFPQPGGNELNVHAIIIGDQNLHGFKP
jgi:hypothetical protein